MIRARFRMALPDDVWIRDVSTSFPDATYRLLTGVPAGDGALELGEVTGDDPAAAVDAVRRHPDVVAFESLYADAERAVARYETVERGLYGFLRDRSLSPEFPVVVENGRMEFDVSATRDRFERFGDALDAADVDYDLLSVVGTADGDAVLTDRQRECLRVALREGYFRVPRECTLEDVATALDVDTSTASETIRRGAARVLEWFLVGPGRSAPRWNDRG